MYTVILLAGGTGSRMKKSIPKQYLLLSGKPVIMHIIERLNKIDEISQIVIVCAPEYKKHISEMLKQYSIEKSVIYADAGNSRQESVLAGLQKVATEKVIIHEAARPFVSEIDFRNLILQKEDTVMYGITIPFTVLKGKEYVEEVLNREELFNVQLPQKFLTKDLLLAHLKSKENGKKFTEDAGMVFEYTGKKVKIIEGKEYNIKLTTSMDFVMGELLYKEYFARRK